MNEQNKGRRQTNEQRNEPQLIVAVVASLSLQFSLSLSLSLSLCRCLQWEDFQYNKVLLEGGRQCGCIDRYSHRSMETSSSCMTPPEVDSPPHKAFQQRLQDDDDSGHEFHSESSEFPTTPPLRDDTAPLMDNHHPSHRKRPVPAPESLFLRPNQQHDNVHKPINCRDVRATTVSPPPPPPEAPAFLDLLWSAEDTDSAFAGPSWDSASPQRNNNDTALPWQPTTLTTHTTAPTYSSAAHHSVDIHNHIDLPATKLFADDACRQSPYPSSTASPSLPSTIFQRLSLTDTNCPTKSPTAAVSSTGKVTPKRVVRRKVKQATPQKRRHRRNMSFVLGSVEGGVDFSKVYT